MAKASFEKSKPALVLEQPQQFNIDEIQLTILSGKGGGLTIRFDISYNPQPGWYFIVYATPPISPGVTRPKQSNFRLIESREVTFTNTVFIFTTAYTARFGVLDLENTYFARLKYVHSQTGFIVDLGYHKSVRLS